MLRLLDARSGTIADVRPARTGVLRVCVYLPEGDGRPDVTGLRVLLVADLLTRVAELGDLQVVTVLAVGGRSPEQVAAVERRAGQLGIHPPAAHVSRAGIQAEAGIEAVAGIQAVAGGPVDVHVVGGLGGGGLGGGGLGGGGGVGTGGGSGLVVNVGAAKMPLLDDCDPLAVRYVLMSVPYHELAEATESVLTGAGETIGRWRTRVAGWAETPSGVIPARIVEAAQAAWSDLDTAPVLALLDGLADDDAVPAGARFESFLYADRVLGLELAREVGRGPYTGSIRAGRDPV